MTKRGTKVAITLAGVLIATSHPAAIKAQGTPSTLPGGATSLREAHGDWTVGCSLQGQPATKVCSLGQEQTDGRTNQRVLAIELRAISKDAARATVVLPFGLDLQKGMTLQVDDAKAAGPWPIRTCLPIGCLADSEIDAATLAALGKGTSLKLNLTADGGKEMTFSVSLKGFAGAYARTLELAKTGGDTPKADAPKSPAKRPGQ